MCIISILFIKWNQDCHSYHVDYDVYLKRILISLVIKHPIIVVENSAAGSTKKTGHLPRPTSPKSPIASASALESGEGSEEDADMTDNADLDTTYLHTNGNAVSF